MINYRFWFLIFSGVMFAENSQAQVSQLHVIVENNPAVPGDANVFCPHIGKWLPTDRKGVVRLPEPYVGDEIIQVAPKEISLYGPTFRRIFPKRDGIISLIAIPVTKALVARADAYAERNETDLGAMAYALVAYRMTSADDRYDYQRKAFELLGKKYGVAQPYVDVGQFLRTTPQLADAVNRNLGYNLPTDRDWKPSDFRKASGLKNYNPIVTDIQQQHFSSLTKLQSTATTGASGPQ